MSNARSPLQYKGVRAIRPPDLTITNHGPSGSDTAFLPGQLWMDKTNLASYQFSGVSWISLGTGAVGGVVTLTGDSGGAISPAGGNITLAGTANEVTTAGAVSTITFSLPSALIAPGSLAVTTTLDVTGLSTLADLTVVGTVDINASGAGITTIGTGGTGAVNIGNATGNTAVTGALSVTNGISVTGGDIINSHSTAGADVTIEVTNSNNANAASRSGVEIATGGASSGDPYLSFQISGVGASTMTMGLDNSASDLFVISNSTAIGTSNALTLSQAGALTATTSITATLGNITATNGNLVLNTAGNKQVYTSVAAAAAAGANSAGTVTLIGGTITVATTAVTASSLIRLTRQSVGATGANDLGILSVGTIVAATSFDINAWTVTDATALQADDVSVVFWEIVN